MSTNESNLSTCQRQPQHQYEDALSRIWIDCAERLGFRIARTGEAYVSYDGRGTIAIGHDELLDGDDSLGQIILHELCHALVEGDEGRCRADWGLDNASEQHVWRERACLRLQAYLASTVGLRDFFAPTTDFRLTFWPNLPANPFSATAGEGGRREPSCVAARLAAWTASRHPWVGPLGRALTASAAIADALQWALQGEGDDTARQPHQALTRLPVQAARALRRLGDAGEGGVADSLWSTVTARPPRHPAGHSVIGDSAVPYYCRDCAWAFVRRGKLHCRHAPRTTLPADALACLRWEAADELLCSDCGACCREAFDIVEVSARDPVNRHHPELLLQEAGRRQVRRAGDRCAALDGGRSPTEPFHCAIYSHRPRTCRDFTRGSENCLQARQRVGLSL